MASQKETHVLDEYMFQILQSNKQQAIRAEDRSDKALQLFMTLLTALFGALVVLLINLEDDLQRNTLTSAGLLIIAGFGFLTFVWIAISNIARQQLALERFHLYQYFRDKDPVTYEKYGQDIYTLNIHKDFMFPQKPFDNISLAVSLSLIALIIFDTVAIAGATYMALLALEIPNLYIPIMVGLLMFGGLIGIWRMGQKRVQTDRLASHKLIAKAKSK
jgi:hypothetical protein